MPELPDLEVFSRNLQKNIGGKKLENLTVVNKSKLKSSEKEFKKAFEKQTLKKVYREGKELRFKFSNENILGLHLMLNGRMYFFEKINDHRNTIFELLFDDEKGLAVTDYQGMAAPVLNPGEKTPPDALSGEVTFRFLKDLLSKKRTTIKTFLLDQKFIRGIGNAYADEILWNALIAPTSVCNKIPDGKIKALVTSIKKILEDAIKQITRSHPDIISGEAREFLDIHNAKKKQSPGGAAIHHQMMGGRITYYTDEQELYK